MSPLRILLLEDSAPDAELIQEFLEAGGIACEVTRVETRAEFLAALEAGGIDLILADYKLPSFDGLSALKLAMSAYPDLPFIFVSGFGEEIAIEALTSGATDYVLKTRLSRLAPSVQRALRETRERTERKAAEARQKLLVDELNHRVKNTLATVQAISEMTLRTAESPAAFREAFQSRLLALSQTHNLLNRNCWQGVSLRELLEQELAPHANNERGRFVLTGDDVQLGPVAAVTLDMAFHELATNAAKYGALSVPGGQVRVAWQADGQGRMHLDWQEAGGPPVQKPQRRGFGSRLIEQSLAGELRGAVHLDFLPPGVRCSMDMALDRISKH